MDGCLRLAVELDEHRRREAMPIGRSRAGRLLEAERRLQQNLAVQREAGTRDGMTLPGARARHPRPTAHSVTDSIRHAGDPGREDQHD